MFPAPVEEDHGLLKCSGSAVPTMLLEQLDDQDIPSLSKLGSFNKDWTRYITIAG